MRVYHYTKEDHLSKILKAGVLDIEKADIGGGARIIRPEQCLLWLTSEEYVPNTARPKDRSFGSNGGYLDINWLRFVFDTNDPRIHKWTIYQKKIRGSKYKATMKRIAKDEGDNPKLWWVSAVPLEIGDYEEASVRP